MMPVDGLDAHAIGVLLLLVATFAAYASSRIPIQNVSLAVLVVLAAGFHLFPYAGKEGTVSPASFFAGFGHEGLIAISSLMIIGYGITITGALRPVSHWLGKLFAKQPQLAILLVLVLSLAASGMVNDTPVVLLMMPVLIGAAERVGAAPSGTLMPMNFAVIVGGMATTIGTSTNLLVVSIAADLGVRHFGIFDFAPMVLLGAIPAVLYLWLILPRLLVKRTPPFAGQKGQLFDAVLHLTADGRAVGSTLADIRGEIGRRFQIVRIVRAPGIDLVRLPQLELAAGDKLFVRASAKDLDELADLLGAKLHGVKEEVLDREEDQDKPQAASDVLAEVVVMNNSPLNGHTLRQVRFADMYGLAVVGLHRRGHGGRSDPADVASTILSTGDVLLVQGQPDDIDNMLDDAGVVILDQSLERPRTSKSVVALAIMAGVVGLATLGVMKISIAAPIGVLAMLATRCINWDDVGRALSAEVILLIAASLALGSALTQTGGTAFIASAIETATRGSSPQFVLVVLMTCMAVLTNFVSNSAAAAIGTPIAVTLAQRLGVSPEPMVLAILLGANFCFVTPMAYQTNLLVMSAAGYTFGDFVRGGLPLALLLLVTFSFLLPLFFPF